MRRRLWARSPVSALTQSGARSRILQMVSAGGERWFGPSGGEDVYSDVFVKIACRVIAHMFGTPLDNAINASNQPGPGGVGLGETPQSNWSSTLRSRMSFHDGDGTSNVNDLTLRRSPDRGQTTSCGSARREPRSGPRRR